VSKKLVKTTTSTEARPLVLASASRYRKALLERLGLPFTIAAPDTDETPLGGETPAETALRLAEAKARSAAARYPEALIIGSDQIADFAGQPIGKPRDPAHAFALLQSMRGRTIIFHTALALLDARSGRCQVALVDVESTFRTLDDGDLLAYLQREQPYDCAGAVKSEALGISLFTRIASDDPTALIGLPLIRLTDMLLNEGVRPLTAPASGS
jgi:septum formation protein